MSKRQCRPARSLIFRDMSVKSNDVDMDEYLLLHSEVSHFDIAKNDALT